MSNTNKTPDQFIPKPLSGHYDEQVALAWKTSLPELDASLIPALALADVAASLINNFHAQALKPHDHNYIEYVILSTLLLNQTGIKPKTFTQLLSNTAAGTTQTINKLEKQGLIKKLANPNDKRSVLVYLTDKGKNIAEELCEAEAKASEKLKSRLTEKDLQDIKGAMSKLIDALK